MGTCFIVLALPFFFKGADSISFTITLLSAVGGATAFLYSKNSQEIQLFRELFREFNGRYDKLNEELNRIYGRALDMPLLDSDHSVLCDYFNLCAEEYLYADAGCIDLRVWTAWQNGMRHFAQDPEIRAFWQDELQQNSYYGFTIPQ